MKPFVLIEDLLLLRIVAERARHGPDAPPCSRTSSAARHHKHTHTMPAEGLAIPISHDQAAPPHSAAVPSTPHSRTVLP